MDGSQHPALIRNVVTLTLKIEGRFAEPALGGHCTELHYAVQDRIADSAWDTVGEVGVLTGKRASETSFGSTVRLSEPVGDAARLCLKVVPTYTVGVQPTECDRSTCDHCSLAVNDLAVHVLVRSL